MKQPKVVHTARGPVEYYEEGTGPAVLCIHGAMGGYDQSITLGRTIGAPGFRYIGVSRPGYLGTPIRCGRTARQQADVHAALLDALGIESAIVMAISGGGPSAAHFALRHPGKCSKLILCSTVGSAAPRKIPLSFYAMMAMAAFPFVTDALKRKTAADLRGAVARSISDPVMLEKTLADAEVMALFKVVLLDSFDQMGKRTVGTKYDITMSASFTCDLESITAPTLVVHGDNDPLLPFADHGRRLAERIAGARLFVAEGGEHVAIFTHRQEVQRAVRDFLGCC
jgi:pimeloyl-ACP methyl ester carboxylesterase